MIRLTSSFIEKLKQVVVFSGAVSIFLSLPIPVVILAAGNGKNTNSSSFEGYVNFLFSHPFVLGVMLLFVIWMFVILAVKESKESKEV